MNKNFKETISAAKKLHKKGLIYLDGFTAEPNYQVLALLIEELNIIMYKAIKDDRGRLIYEMDLLTFEETDLISEGDIEFKEYLIEGFIDVDDPVLIVDEYCFVTKMDKLGEIYDKALEQIAEGKFKNMIF